MRNDAFLRRLWIGGFAESAGVSGEEEMRPATGQPDFLRRRHFSRPSWTDAAGALRGHCAAGGRTSLMEVLMRCWGLLIFAGSCCEGRALVRDREQLSLLSVVFVTEYRRYEFGPISEGLAD